VLSSNNGASVSEAVDLTWVGAGDGDMVVGNRISDTDGVKQDAINKVISNSQMSFIRYLPNVRARYLRLFPY
jgi:hypothetical protein